MPTGPPISFHKTGARVISSNATIAFELRPDPNQATGGPENTLIAFGFNQ